MLLNNVTVFKDQRTRRDENYNEFFFMVLLVLMMTFTPDARAVTPSENRILGEVVGTVSLCVLLFHFSSHIIKIASVAIFDFRVKLRK